MVRYTHNMSIYDEKYPDGIPDDDVDQTGGAKKKTKKTVVKKTKSKSKAKKSKSKKTKSKSKKSVVDVVAPVKKSKSKKTKKAKTASKSKRVAKK